MGDAAGGSFGHGDRLIRRRDPTPDLSGVCHSPHPLLEGVYCQRMEGHHGRHRASAESARAEFDLEWGDEAKARFT